MVEEVKEALTTRSWKTTIAGLLTALVVIGPELAKLLDDDAATNPSWGLVAMAVGGALGFAVSKDHDKTGGVR